MVEVYRSGKDTDFVRLTKQMQFILEIDKAKQVVRQTVLIDGSRRENDAEHSWHLAMMALWAEYEERKTPEATFAKALDHLQPLLHNYHNDGVTWRKNNISREQVLEKKREMANSAPVLWEYVQSLVDEAAKKGLLLA